MNKIALWFFDKLKKFQLRKQKKETIHHIQNVQAKSKVQKALPVKPRWTLKRLFSRTPKPVETKKKFKNIRKSRSKSTVNFNQGEVNAVALTRLYSGQGLVSFTGWHPVVLTESATGNDNEYFLPAIPISSDCILMFINGVRTFLFEYNESTNTVIFSGNIPESYNVSAFVLGRIV